MKLLHIESGIAEQKTKAMREAKGGLENLVANEGRTTQAAKAG